MSVGPMGGIAASAAGAPLAQTKGSDVERSQHAASNQERRVQNDVRADSAAGIGETDGENHEAAERDADGRRPWEATPNAAQPAANEENSAQHQAKDASGQCGKLLDLSG